ncbi:hypothetical protein D3C86_1557350 [compost metagenome]
MLGHGLRAHDLHRGGFLLAHALHFHGLGPFHLGRGADDAVLLLLAAGLEAEEQRFDEAADVFGHGEPREMEE